MQAVTTLAGTIASSLIPGDYTIKSLCGQAITQTLNALLNRPDGGGLRDRIPFLQTSEVIVYSGTPMYDKLEEYLTQSFIDKFRTCQLIAKRGDISYSLHARFPGLKDKYQGHHVSIEPFSPTTSGPPNGETVHALRITSRTASVKLLRDYVNHICDFKNVSSNILKVYQGRVEKETKKDKANVGWVEVDIKTNKTVTNTIVSESVKKEFFDDVENFMMPETEQWYNQKGIPYKRGYALHGPPGTGKTSAIKAIANRHRIDIFTIDVEVVENTNQLIELLSEVTYLANTRPHILALEDVDRSKLFKKWNADIAMSSLLNAIDGVVESYGRLLIMTANDITPLKEVEALMRPGRIDKTILMDRFQAPEVGRLIKHYYGIGDGEEEEVVSLDQITLKEPISPADLVQVLQTYPSLDQLEQVIERIGQPTDTKAKEQDQLHKQLSKEDKRLETQFEAVKKSQQALKKLEASKTTSERFLLCADEKIKKAKERVENAKESKAKALKRSRETRKKMTTKPPPIPRLESRSRKRRRMRLSME